MSRNNGQKGQILIEFILIAPVLLAIAGGAIEIARFLRFNQVASVFSQEAAATAYRQCSDFFMFTATDTFDSTATKTATEQCLSNLRTRIERRLLEAYPQQGSDGTATNNPQFLVVLSIYRRDQVSEVSGGIGFSSLTHMKSLSSAAGFSLYKANGNTIVKETAPSPPVFSGEEINKMERVVIAEVVYMYTPVIPIYKLLMGNIDLIKTDRGFRETTIL